MGALLGEAAVTVSVARCAELIGALQADADEMGCLSHVPPHVLQMCGGVDGLRKRRHWAARRLETELEEAKVASLDPVLRELGLQEKNTGEGGKGEGEGEEGGERESYPLPLLLSSPWIPSHPSPFYEQGKTKHEERVKLLLEEQSGARGKKAKTGLHTGSGSRNRAPGLNHGIPIPVFNPHTLSNRGGARGDIIALQPLYLQRMFQFGEDSMRFKTQEDLNEYIYQYAKIKQSALKKTNSAATLQRDWYCTADEWSDHRVAQRVTAELEAQKDKEDSGKGKKEKKGTGSITVPGYSEEGNVLEDDHFPRCPISKDKFLRKFDEDEGETLFLRACKVFVTAGADVAVYKLGQPTAHPDIRYVVVSRPLVLLAWLEEGRCASVKEIAGRFRSAVADNLGLAGKFEF